MIRSLASGIVVCAMLVTTQAKAAGDSGAYLGIGGGLAEIGVDELDFKENDIAYKVFGGYSFSDLIAFEGAYILGGEPSDEVTSGVREATATGINASVLLRARTGSSFALYAKIGYTMYDFKLTETLNDVSSDLVDQSDSGISYGLGVTYTIDKKYLVRIEYEGVQIDDGKFNMVMLGAGYRF